MTSSRKTPSNMSDTTATRGETKKRKSSMSSTRKSLSSRKRSTPNRNFVVSKTQQNRNFAELKTQQNVVIGSLVNHSIASLEDREHTHLTQVCNSSGICISLGSAEIPRINNFFDGFINFALIQNIKRVGSESANGFVHQIEYMKRDYIAHAILKSAMNPNSDNLFYEFLVGYFFINEQKKNFTCFLETYGFGQYKNDTCWTNYRNKPRNATIMAKTRGILSCIDFFPNNAVYSNINEFLNRSCKHSSHITLLIEHIKDAKSLDSMLNDENGEFITYDLLSALYQIYLPLSCLSKKFTHYDLHTENVLIYEPFAGEKKCFLFTYTFPDGKTVSFKTKYMVKIIDYGRSFYKKDEKVNAMTLYGKLCNERKTPDCNVSRENRCGENLGYDSFSDGFSSFFINSSLKNESHDLRLLHIMNTDEDIRDAIIENNPDLYDIISHVKFDAQYGTPEVLTSGINSNPPSINNVTDACKVLQQLLKMDLTQEQINDYYSDYDFYPIDITVKNNY